MKNERFITVRLSSEPDPPVEEAIPATGALEGEVIETTGEPPGHADSPGEPAETTGFSQVEDAMNDPGEPVLTTSDEQYKEPGNEDNTRK